MKQLLIATCLLLVWLLPGWGAAKEDGARKRTVVLVYDDSGSMRANKSGPLDRWKYASYALQSFVGLLDEKDAFSYVPMSRPSQEISVSLQQRQQELDALRRWNSSKDTPFQAVETAMQSLKRQVQTNKDGEFWLIVLTDGVFNDLESPNSPQYASNKQKMTDTLQSFKKWTEQQNLSFHSVLITMESSLNSAEKAQMNTFKAMWQEQLNGSVMSTNGEDGIIESVNQAAALIANRDPFSQAEDLVKTSLQGNMLKVNIPFPIHRMTIVQQSSSAAEASQIVPGGKLVSRGPYMMQTPGSVLLTGYVSQVAYRDGSVMKPGEYELPFAKPVSSAQQMKVLVEPALDYTVKLYRQEESKLVPADAKVYDGSTVIVEAKPSEVPANPAYFSASVEMGGSSEPMNWNRERQAFQYELKAGSSDIRGNISMNIKGFYQQTKEFRIQPKPKPVLTLQVMTQDWRAPVTELGGSPPLVIRPLQDGKPMEAAEVEKLLAGAKVQLDERVDYELKRHGNELYLYPKPYGSDTFNFTYTGKVNGTLRVLDGAGQRVSAKFSFTVDDVSFLERYHTILKVIVPGAMLLIAVSILLIGWTVRPRFHRRGLMYYELDQSLTADWVHQSEPELLRNKWWKHYLGVPFRAERRTVQSLTFIAKKGAKAVYIAKESQVEGMLIDGSYLTAEEAGRELKSLYPNETVMIDRGYGKEVYRYECE
ncbi:vWA domain-containing protein [Ectobacillus ponti]|uniref:VWA domain-containing protein n=1 Tax=Ectobacillus ponti TaxID=2961894 RepID=A0AA42BQ92_9BACI|nr:vWA domain-containing protein [Ectobacillus ponti]MCP8969161.1 VWA domain-containing protein [Ectobacillus ponti]